MGRLTDVQKMQHLKSEHQLEIGRLNRTVADLQRQLQQQQQAPPPRQPTNQRQQEQASSLSYRGPMRFYK